jgi:hypothetical protein
VLLRNSSLPRSSSCNEVRITDVIRRALAARSSQIPPGWLLRFGARGVRVIVCIDSRYCRNHGCGSQQKLYAIWRTVSREVTELSEYSVERLPEIYAHCRSTANHVECTSSVRSRTDSLFLDGQLTSLILRYPPINKNFQFLQCQARTTQRDERAFRTQKP